MAQQPQATRIMSLKDMAASLKDPKVAGFMLGLYDDLDVARTVSFELFGDRWQEHVMAVYAAWIEHSKHLRR